jgi:Fur family peroxide stress response transcriptional regulator
MASPVHLTDLRPGHTGEKGHELRLTRQRREVYDVLVSHRDHPTVQDVFQRAKVRMPNISLATVYNCLEALTHVGLVRQVNLDRAPSRYCPNLEDHGHFHCEGCGKITDIELAPNPQAIATLPNGTLVHKLEVNLRGLCPDCASPPSSSVVAGN